MTAEELSEMLHHVGRALALTTRVPALSGRMFQPQVGDLVIETSSMRGYDPDGVGWLHEKVGANPGWPDRWVVEPLRRPGETVEWENASFVALPTEHFTRWLKAEEVPDEARADR